MSTYRRTLATLLAVACSLAALLAGAPLALAQRPPDNDNGAVYLQPTPPAPNVSHGSPLWQFAVVAVAAAALTLVALLAARKLRHAPHPSTAHA